MAEQITLEVPGTTISGLHVTAQALCPVEEARDAGAHPSTFPTVAGVLVQYAPAEFAALSVGGPDVLARSAAAFVAAPRVEAFIQPAAGHDIGVHRVARAYHLRVLAFAEDHLAQRSVTEPEPPGPCPHVPLKGRP
jgi:hypothetical protein